MEERFKQKDKQKSDPGITHKPQFKSFDLKSKEGDVFRQLEKTDFASKAKFTFTQKVDFKDVGTAQEIKIKSTSEKLKVGFEGVAGTNSGFFFARTEGGGKLAALLEDEADTANPRHTFNGSGSLRTHIVPVGKVGDRAVFKVVDQTSGEEAFAVATTYAIGGQGLWGVLKNLFS